MRASFRLIGLLAFIVLETGCTAADSGAGTARGTGGSAPGTGGAVTAGGSGGSSGSSTGGGSAVGGAAGTVGAGGASGGSAGAPGAGGAPGGAGPGGAGGSGGAILSREGGSVFDVAPPRGPGAVVYEQGMKMADVERAAITAALQATRGNRRRAAEMLGIGERTLYRKLKEYEMEDAPSHLT